MRSRLALVACSLLFSIQTGFALDLTALKPQGYLSDFAGVVDAGSRQEIESYCARVEQATTSQIALVTLRTLEGDPIEDVANDLFRRWGIGKKGKDNGLLLLLVVQDRRSRLEVGRGLEEFIPDGFAGGILRQITPALRHNDYGTAMLTAAQILGGKVAQAQGVAIPGDTVRRPRPVQDTGATLPWPLIVVGGLFLLMLLMNGMRGGGGGGGLLSGLILGQLLGGGGRSRGGWGGGGGGGFGGYDSGGGGFGGFGGGDSGGAGASRSW